MVLAMTQTGRYANDFLCVPLLAPHQKSACQINVTQAPPFPLDSSSLVPDAQTVANVLLASVMRDFFLRVLGSYRFFINSMSEARGVHAGSKGNYYSLKVAGIQDRCSCV